MKMWLITLLVVVGATTQAQEKFTVNGKIGKLDKPATIYLSYQHEEQNVEDSVVLSQGTFSFSGEVEEPSQARLTLSHDGDGSDKARDWLSFYVHEGVIKVNAPDSLKHADIEGSKINADYKKYWQSLKPATSKLIEIVVLKKNTPSEERESESFKGIMEEKESQMEEEKKKCQISFIKEHPDSYISLVALTEYTGNIQELELLTPLFESLSPETKNSPAGKRYAELLKNTRLTEIGNAAPTFTQNDSNGNPVSLKDFRGKYVLIDFWASWCVPCRAENPNVIKAYNKYKDENFTVLGVSLDSQSAREDWLKAVKNDGLIWTQVSDLKGWKNEVAVKYAVHSIPQNILVDPQGIIIAKNLRGEALEKKLDEIYSAAPSHDFRR